MKKTLYALFVILLLAIPALGGCGEQEAPPDFAQIYVQGILDTLYQGEYTEEFLTVTDTEDPAELEAEYLAGLDTEVNYFAYYFGIDELSESAKTDLTALYRDLYRLSRYEVLPSVPLEDDYIVDVIVEPLDVIDRVVKEDLESFAFEMKSASSYGITSDEYEQQYVEGLIERIREKMETPGYREPVTIKLEVVRNSDDGLYYIKGNGLAEIDEQVLRY